MAEWEWKRPDPCGFGRAVWSSASAHLRTAITKPTAWGGGSVGGVLKSLSWKRVIWSQRRSSQQSFCFNGPLMLKATSLHTVIMVGVWVHVYQVPLTHACIYCMHDVLHLSMYVCMYLGLFVMVWAIVLWFQLKGIWMPQCTKYFRQWHSCNFLQQYEDDSLTRLGKPRPETPTASQVLSPSISVQPH